MSNDQMPEDLFQEALRADAENTQTPADPAPQETTETPAQDPVETQEAPETPAAEDEWRELARSMGYEVEDGSSVKDVLTRIHNDRNTAAQQAAYYQQQIRQVEPETPKPEKPAGTPEDELADYFSQKWAAPQIDQKWFDLVERNEAGHYVPRTHNGIPIASQEIVQKVNEYTQWFQQKPLEFFENPYQKVYEAIQEPLTKRFEKLVEQRLQAILSQRETTSEIEQFETDHKDQLYQLDSKGNILQDNQGRPILKDYGQQLRGAMEEFYQDGITDPRKLLRLARRVVGEPPAQQVEEAAEEKPEQPEPKKKFLEQAIRKASTGGGTDAEASAGPADGVMVTETELDNMFVAASRQ